jgi:hypothetical protein
MLSLGGHHQRRCIAEPTEPVLETIPEEQEDYVWDGHYGTAGCFLW